MSPMNPRYPSRLHSRRSDERYVVQRCDHLLTSSIPYPTLISILISIRYMASVATEEAEELCFRVEGVYFWYSGLGGESLWA